MKINPNGFREYDARWIFEKDIDIEGITNLGKGLGTQIINNTKKNNPRVIVIQKIYSKTFNKEEKITFEKHRFKKFIKDVVLGTLERDEVLYEEINKSLNDIKFQNMDKILQTIIKSAAYELLYKTKIPRKIIIKEYLNASNFFIDSYQ